MTRIKVRVLLDQGLTGTEVARVLDLSPPTVSYHRGRLGRKVDERFSRRYDWRAIQDYYDQGHSIRECAVVFGFSRQTWHEAVQRGAIASRPARKEIDHYLVASDEMRTKRTYLKGKLIEAGLKEDRCEECGIAQWRGRRIALALHHVNGIGNDNRLEKPPDPLPQLSCADAELRRQESPP